MNKFLWLPISLIIVGLSACAVQPVPEDSITPFDLRNALEAERNESIPASAPSTSQNNSIASPTALTDELLTLGVAPKNSAKFDIEAIDRPAKQFFSELGRSQGVNMLVDPRVDGTISLSLSNVTLSNVLSALQDSYGFDFETTSYGYRVSPNQIATRLYQINYLNVSRAGASKTEVGGDDANTLTTSFSANENASGTGAFWSGLERSINGFIQSTGPDAASTVIVNDQTGLVVVTATTKEHTAISEFLINAELILQKQVIIEAKIVEVTLADEYRSGIDWDFLSSNIGGGATTSSGLAANTFNGNTDLGGVFNLNFALDNFTSMLQLLDYQGDVQVLSSPRVSTINNQKAVIKVGADEYFATVTSVETDGEDDSTTLTPSIELEQFFSGIALDVTPQIADDNSVTLHVRPMVSEVTEQTKEIEINGTTLTLPLAYTNIRESDSIIRAKNGQIVVIGGLLQQNSDNNSSGIPMLGRVPGLSFLFAQERQQQTKSELVILLKPTIYDEFTSMSDLDQVLERLE